MGSALGCANGKMCGKDVDDLFAYSTTKMVKIRDARLGLLHYGMMLVIVLYIILYQLIALGGYLHNHDATNTVRLTLQQPTVPVNGVPCNPNHQNCDDDFSPLDELDYCKNATHTHQGPFLAYECYYLDGAGAADIRANSIMMQTATHSYKQTRTANCAPGSKNCTKVWNYTSDATYYVVEPEKFTLMCDHSLTTAGLTLKSDKEEGFLYVQQGNSVQDDICAGGEAYADIWSGTRKSKAPCYLRPQTSETLQDFFEVGLLLNAMGVTLDQPSDVPGSQKPGKRLTKRYDGLVVSVSMEYHNFYNFHLGETNGLKYVYRLQEVKPSSGFKATRIVNTNYPNEREKEDNHGVLFVFEATGQLRSFDFTTLLLQLTTSLALTAVATTVVNLLAQNFLKYSPFYNQAIYHITEDFSDLRDTPDEELESELRSRGLDVPQVHTEREGTQLDRTQAVLSLLDHGWKPRANPSPGSPNVASEHDALQIENQAREQRLPLAAAGASSSSGAV